MKEKRISSYVVNKHDIEVNWRNAVNFTPEKGQFIVYDKEIDENGNLIAELPDDRTTPYVNERFKIGDGHTNVNLLPFLDSIDEIYIGDGDMPENATIQIIMDATDEEELLKNELTEYIDSELTKAKESGEFRGEQGPKGDQGPKGNTGAQGPKGNDGYTPVKGTDYWTAADQQAMIEAVLNALPIGEEAVF